jgi:hypothetical protein
MIRKNTYEVEVNVIRDEKLDFIHNRAIYFSDDSLAVYEAYIDGEVETGGHRIQISPAVTDLIFVDDHGNEVTLTDEEYKKAEDLAYAITEDNAYDVAWEERYEED